MGGVGDEGGGWRVQMRRHAITRSEGIFVSSFNFLILHVFIQDLKKESGVWYKTHYGAHKIKVKLKAGCMRRL